MNLNKRFMYFHPVYHKDDWFYIPLNCPEEAIGDDGYLYPYQFSSIEGKTFPKTRFGRCCSHALEFLATQVKGVILPDQLPELALKKLCRRNNLPLNLVTTQYHENYPEKEHQERVTRRGSRAISTLSKDEYDKFIKELKRINKKSFLIAEILWSINQDLEEVDDFVGLEEILRLSIQNVATENESNTICLTRTCSQGSRVVIHQLPKKLWKALGEQIHPDFLFVFSNKKGGPLLPGDVIKHFKLAGKRAEITKSIGSLSLRPTSRNNCLAKYPICEPIEQDNNQNIQKISEKEWVNILSQFPKLTQRRGRISEHDPRDIFNGILFHLRTGIPIKKLSSAYPSCSAVDSQYRRWKRNGLFDAILEFRQ